MIIIVLVILILVIYILAVYNIIIKQFINLQKSLTKMENQIQAARRIYNNEVEKYNNTINIFPNNILANVFKFSTEEFFKMEEQ